MCIIWCISITNNAISCKKIYITVFTLQFPKCCNTVNDYVISERPLNESLWRPEDPCKSKRYKKFDLFNGCPLLWSIYLSFSWGAINWDQSRTHHSFLGWRRGDLWEGTNCPEPTFINCIHFLKYSVSQSPTSLHRPFQGVAVYYTGLSPKLSINDDDI